MRGFRLSGRRLEEPERLYDREAVLGRDTTSARRPHWSCRRRGADALARIPRSQVFPTLASKAAGLDWAAAGTRPAWNVRARLSSDTSRPAGGSSAAPQFVTEAELEELKAQRGGTVEDGTISVDKPLYEVLRENKEKKARVRGACVVARGLNAALQEEEFQDKWRIMKQGKNKPLEAEEIEFLDSVVAHEMEAERRKRAEEAQELQSFQVGLATLPCA